MEERSTEQIQKIDWERRIRELLQSRKLQLVEVLETPLCSASLFKVRCDLDQHEWSTTFNWLNLHKHGCRKCSGLLATTPALVTSSIEVHGFSLLKPLPVKMNNTTRFELKCSQGHEYETNWNKFSPNFRCPFCSGALVHPIDFTKRLSVRGFETKDQYNGIHSPLKLVCKKKGHEVLKSYYSIWNDGTKCPQCDPPYSSKDEEELATWLKTILPEKEIFRNDRVLLKGQEIDIFIPSKKFGIELSGLYYHNEFALLARGKTPSEARAYHQSKYVRALKEGVQLVTIWDYEWKMRREAVCARLKSLLGLNPIRIGARRVDARKFTENDFQQVQKFLDRYHLQGKARFKHAYGLLEEGELLSVMTFQPHHRQNIPTLVLNRYCVKADYTVAGGAKKLFKLALKDLAQPVLSYSDNRWSTGGIYNILGFEKIRASPPDYFYADFSNRNRPFYSKQSKKKTKLEQALPETEYELRRKQNLLRVWDCGKVTWLYRP
jgi:hypothetical protein